MKQRISLSMLFVFGASLMGAACELPWANEPEPAPPPPDETTTEVTMTPVPPAAEPEPEPEPTEPVIAEPEVPEPKRDGVHETDEQTRGRLPPRKITPVLDAHGEQFNECYAKALAANPKLAGRVTLVIVIAPDGSVPHAEVMTERTTLEDVGVHRCLIQEAKTLEFDRPVGGRVVTQYPLEFKPAPAAAPAAEVHAGPAK